jgi:hypothetical protein
MSYEVWTVVPCDMCVAGLIPIGNDYETCGKCHGYGAVKITTFTPTKRKVDWRLKAAAFCGGIVLTIGCIWWFITGAFSQ